MQVPANESFDGFFQVASLYGARILAAMIAGAVIGLENQVYEKPAGLRTNILLCLGCALVTIVSITSGIALGDSPTRITAQILTGIGFLGGGVILHNSSRVTGITTASTIFVNAAIGITIGSGYIFSGVAIALIAATVLILLRPVDTFIEFFPFFVHLRERELQKRRRRAKKSSVLPGPTEEK